MCGWAAEPAHRLAFARDPLAADLVQAFGLDQGEGHIAVEHRVVGQVDLLLAALAQEALDLVAAVDEGRGTGIGYRVSGLGQGRGIAARSAGLLPVPGDGISAIGPSVAVSEMR